MDRRAGTARDATTALEATTRRSTLSEVIASQYAHAAREGKHDGTARMQDDDPRTLAHLVMCTCRCAGCTRLTTFGEMAQPVPELVEVSY